MNQAALMEVVRTYDAALHENGATGLFMFGSRALGVSRPDSDLDRFIDYDPESKGPGIVDVAAFAARAETSPPTATSTSTRRSTRSPANAGSTA